VAKPSYQWGATFRAAENGLKQAVTEAKTAAWKRENAKAVESSNVWAEKHGLPL
jgi:antitoxin CcdA